MSKFGQKLPEKRGTWKITPYVGHPVETGKYVKNNPYAQRGPTRPVSQDEAKIMWRHKFENTYALVKLAYNLWRAEHVYVSANGGKFNPYDRWPPLAWKRPLIERT